MLESKPLVEMALVAADQLTVGVRLFADCSTYPAGLVGHNAVIVIGTLFVVT